MNFNDLLDGMKRFGATNEEVCLSAIGVKADQIQERVIIAPWWEPTVFSNLGRQITYLSPAEIIPTKVWNIAAADFDVTYIKTGIGSPVMMDSVLALGLTRCKKAVFVGSAGALDLNIGIGDIVIPEYSICGDGASRYLCTDPVKEKDVFGEKNFPDAGMVEKLKKATVKACRQQNVRWHIGINFSIDTIFAQYVHIDEVIDMGCNTIEMETAAAFKAAELAGISLAALFSISDNTLKNKSLVSGRTEEEHVYRCEVRRTIFPRIILDALD